MPLTKRSLRAAEALTVDLAMALEAERQMWPVRPPGGGRSAGGGSAQLLSPGFCGTARFRGSSSYAVLRTPRCAGRR